MHGFLTLWCLCWTQKHIFTPCICASSFVIPAMPIWSLNLVFKICANSTFSKCSTWKYWWPYHWTCVAGPLGVLSLFPPTNQWWLCIHLIVGATPNCNFPTLYHVTKPIGQKERVHIGGHPFLVFITWHTHPDRAYPINLNYPQCEDLVLD